MVTSEISHRMKEAQRKQIIQEALKQYNEQMKEAKTLILNRVKKSDMTTYCLVKQFISKSQAQTAELLNKCLK